MYCNEGNFKRVKLSFRGRVAGTKGMSEDEAMKMFTARQPTGRFCSKEEVANLALYLGGSRQDHPGSFKVILGHFRGDATVYLQIVISCLILYNQTIKRLTNPAILLAVNISLMVVGVYKNTFV